MSKYNKNTDELLMSTAERLFFEKGYAEVSGRGICEVAGVSRSRLHYYYADKEELASIILRKSLADLHYKLRDYVFGKTCRTGTEQESDFVYMTTLIMCLVGILSKDISPSKFYSECMDAGVASRVLSEYLEKSMNILNRDIDHPYDERHIKTFARMFANAFSANSKKYKTNDAQEEYSLFFGEVYSDLYMKMLDIDANKRKKIIDKAESIYKKLRISFKSMYEIEITKL